MRPPSVKLGFQGANIEIQIVCCNVPLSNSLSPRQPSGKGSLLGEHFKADEGKSRTLCLDEEREKKRATQGEMQRGDQELRKQKRSRNNQGQPKTHQGPRGDCGFVVGGTGQPDLLGVLLVKVWATGEMFATLSLPVVPHFVQVYTSPPFSPYTLEIGLYIWF